MDFYTTAQSISLAPAEKAQVKAAQSRIKAAEAHAAPFCGCGPNGEPSAPQLKINELAEKYKVEPSAAIAKEIAEQALLHEAAKGISGHLGGICEALRVETSKALFPLAQELTARTIAELDRQLKAAITGLEKIDGMNDAIADIVARHRRQVEIGNYDVAELADRPGCALPWIVGNFEAAA
jgi:hypothetical protein